VPGVDPVVHDRHHHVLGAGPRVPRPLDPGELVRPLPLVEPVVRGGHAVIRCAGSTASTPGSAASASAVARSVPGARSIRATRRASCSASPACSPAATIRSVACCPVVVTSSTPGTTSGSVGTSRPGVPADAGRGCREPASSAAEVWPAEVWPTEVWAAEVGAAAVVRADAPAASAVGPVPATSRAVAARAPAHRPHGTGPTGAGTGGDRSRRCRPRLPHAVSC
jgi:hypothetical protein